MSTLLDANWLNVDTSRARTIKFSATLNDTGDERSTTATPSYTGVPYYCHYATEQDVERWKQEYGTDDMKVLIEKGSIGELLAGLQEIGFFEDVTDFYLWFNSIGSIRNNYFPCKASTKYIFFAVKWNEQCEVVGEVSTYEYTTQPVAPSNNKITLSVGEVTQSTAQVTATVTNDDSYVIYPVESHLLVGKTNEEIFEYMDQHYYLSEFTFSGNTTREYALLKSGMDYTFVAFGHKAKSMTTSDYDYSSIMNMASARQERALGTHKTK